MQEIISQTQQAMGAVKRGKELVGTHKPDEALAEYSRQSMTLLKDATYVPLPGLERDVFDVGVEQVVRELRRHLT